MRTNRFQQVAILAVATALVAVVSADCVGPRLLAGENDSVPAATNSSQQNSTLSTAPAHIKRLIADLSSSDYRTREDATRELCSAGPESVGDIAKAAAADDLEAAFRSVRVLQTMLQSDQPAVETRAVASLEQLAAKDSAVSDLATDALAGYNVVRQERAIEELRSLGAEVNISGTDYPGKVGDYLSLILGAKKWRGVSADLARIKQLPNLYEISFYGVKVDDQVARLLADLEKKPNRLNLFGTDISDADFAIITDKIHSPETAVARRGGAKLGIGTRDLNSCVISTVQPGSAAEKAGIQFNDEITSFDGQPVQTFSDLTDLIARKNPSETVSLEIRRNGDTIQKTISLGQWN